MKTTPACRAVLPRGGRPVLTLLAVMTVVLAVAPCEAVDMATTARQGEPPQGAVGPLSPDAIPLIVTLAFDLPEGFSARETNGEFVVQGFHVGYFAPDGSGPLRQMTFTRDAVRVDGTTGFVMVTLLSVPRGPAQVMLRVRTLSSRLGPGTWSAPSAPVTLPASSADAPAGSAAPEASGESPAAGRRERRQALSMVDVERRPRLQEALESLLTPDFGAEDALVAFQTVERLAQAVALAVRHDLAFDELTAAIDQSGPSPLREAFAQLRPSADAAGAIRDARRDARALLDGRAVTDW